MQHNAKFGNRFDSPRLPPRRDPTAIEGSVAAAASLLCPDRPAPTAHEGTRATGQTLGQATRTNKCMPIWDYQACATLKYRVASVLRECDGSLQKKTRIAVRVQALARTGWPSERPCKSTCIRKVRTTVRWWWKILAMSQRIRDRVVPRRSPSRLPRGNSLSRALRSYSLYAPTDTIPTRLRAINRRLFASQTSVVFVPRA